MIQVHFTGWREGLQKVSLTQLLQHQGNLSLQKAKTSVDLLLDGESFTIQCSTLTEAETLVFEATRLGAICSIDS